LFISVDGHAEENRTECIGLFVGTCKYEAEVTKGKGLDTCYGATYMSQTRDQQRFTFSEVAIGMSLWCHSALCGHPLPALTDNTYGAASRHTIAPISHTRPSLRSRSYYSFPVLMRVGG